MPKRHNNINKRLLSNLVRMAGDTRELYLEHPNLGVKTAFAHLEEHIQCCVDLVVLEANGQITTGLNSANHHELIDVLLEDIYAFFKREIILTCPSPNGTWTEYDLNLIIHKHIDEVLNDEDWLELRGEFGNIDYELLRVIMSYLMFKHKNRKSGVTDQTTGR